MKKTKSRIIRVVKCPCGHPACQKYQLEGIGSFSQGSGFTKAEATLIARLLNKKKRSPSVERLAMSTIAIYGYAKREGVLEILRTNRAKEVCGDCETGDNSARMITLDGKIWQNEKDCRKELLRRDEIYEYDSHAVAHVKVTLEVLLK